MKHSLELNSRQRIAVEAVATGQSYADAGRNAGYSASNAKQQVCNLLKKPHAQTYLQSIQASQEKATHLTIERKRIILQEIVESDLSVTDRIKAMQEDSKLAGHYTPERSETKHTFDNFFENTPMSYGLGR